MAYVFCEVPYAFSGEAKCPHKPSLFSRNSCEFYCRCVPASEGLTLGNCYLKKAAGYIL